MSIRVSYRAGQHQMANEPEFSGDDQPELRQMATQALISWVRWRTKHWWVLKATARA